MPAGAAALRISTSLEDGGGAEASGRARGRRAPARGGGTPGARPGGRSAGQAAAGRRGQAAGVVAVTENEEAGAVIGSGETLFVNRFVRGCRWPPAATPSGIPRRRAT